jgi:hypothetical protein
MNQYLFVEPFNSVPATWLNFGTKDRCVPEELQSLKNVLPSIAILRYGCSEFLACHCLKPEVLTVLVLTSPNAEEALSLLALPKVPTKQLVEHAASKLIDMGVGKAGTGCVIIRSGAMGAYVVTRAKGGQWIDAFWNDDRGKIIDVTGR